jgi:hypothetical protein
VIFRKGSTVVPSISMQFSDHDFFLCCDVTLSVARHIFQACSVWIYTQSINITNIIFTWLHYTNTEKMTMFLNIVLCYITMKIQKVSHVRLL